MIVPMDRIGDIEDAETGAGNQQRNDDHIVYGLFSLKFHHASGNNILVGSMFTASKPWTTVWSMII